MLTRLWRRLFGPPKCKHVWEQVRRSTRRSHAEQVLHKHNLPFFIGPQPSNGKRYLPCFAAPTAIETCVCVRCGEIRDDFADVENEVLQAVERQRQAIQIFEEWKTEHERQPKT